MDKLIPLFKVNMSLEAKTLVGEVLDSGMCGEGPKVEEFTKKLKALWDQPNVVCLNSCTSALTLALRLANIGPGDKVLSTPFTFPATNCAIAASGAEIVWGLLSEHDLCLDLHQAAETLKDIGDIDAVVLTLVAGIVPKDLEFFMEECARLHVPVIADCAHAFQTTYKDKHISHWVDYCCFSFQSIKHLTTGDGGALTCSYRYDHTRAEKLKWFGMTREVPLGMSRLEHQMSCLIQEWGYKFHMNDISAAIGLANFDLAIQSVYTSRANACFFEEGLPSEMRILPAPFGHASWWTYPIKYSGRLNTLEAVKRCESAGVVVSPMWMFNNRHPCFASAGLTNVSFEKSTPIFIPNGFWVGEEEREKVLKVVKEVLHP